MVSNDVQDAVQTRISHVIKLTFLCKLLRIEWLIKYRTFARVRINLYINIKAYFDDLSLYLILQN